MTMKTLLLFVLVTVSAFAQQRFSGTTGDVVLAGAGTTLTIQQPATPIKQIALESVTVYCSAACNVTQSQNGTAATTTVGTLTPISPFYRNSSVTVFTSSNVGAGTAIGGIIHLAAGQMVVIDLSQIVIGATPTANYSISVSSITGTANISVIESERIS